MYERMYEQQKHTNTYNVTQRTTTNNIAEQLHAVVFVVVCCVVPCCVVSCCVMLCYVVLGYVVLCRVVLCYVVVLCDAVLGLFCAHNVRPCTDELIMETRLTIVLVQLDVSSVHYCVLSVSL